MLIEFLAQFKVEIIKYLLLQKQNNKTLKKVDKKELDNLDNFLRFYGEKSFNKK